MAPLRAEVIAVLNERAANRVAQDLEDAIGNSGRGASDQFNRNLSEGLRGMPLRNLGVEAGNEFRTGMRNGIDDVIRDFTSQFGTLGQTANSAFSGISSSAEGAFAGMSRGGAIAAGGVAAVGVAAVVAGKQLYDLGSTWDDIGDSIAVRTGKLGSDLESTTGIVRELGAVTAAPLESIGDIAGRVSQSLGLTGNDLTSVVQNIANVKEMTGELLDVREWGKASRIFDIGGSDQVAALNSLFNASQDTGASINELVATMTTAGKSATEFGLGFGETAALLASFEAAGVDMVKVAPAMTIALKNFAAAGQEPQQALRDTIVEIKNLADAGNAVQATSLAADTFGRGYIDFLNAIKGGDLDIAALNKSLDGTATRSLPPAKPPLTLISSGPSCPTRYRASSSPPPQRFSRRSTPASSGPLAPSRDGATCSTRRSGVG